MPKLSEIFLLKEDVDVKKLHDPEQFAKEAGEFVKETNAELQVLTHFAQGRFPGFSKALTDAQQAMTALEAEIKSVEGQLKQAAAKEAATQATAQRGTTFSKK